MVVGEKSEHHGGSSINSLIRRSVNGELPPASCGDTHASSREPCANYNHDHVQKHGPGDCAARGGRSDGHDDR